tara:strand:+ start:4178 stop:4933 length:756 start_codon:yes stop_codon:yes gene_type:complete
MYLTFKNGKILKDLVDICKDIVSEINLEIQNEGIIMQAMDMSHVSLISFFIHKEDFSLYNVDKEEVLSLSLKSLNMILKCYKESFQLSLNTNNDGFLQVIFYSNDIDNDTDKQYTWNLTLLNIESETLSIPSDDSQIEINMNANEFSEMIKNMSSFGDSLQIKIIGKLLHLQVSGDIGNVEVHKSFNKDKMKTKGNMELSVAMRYLLLFIKGSTLTQDLKIKMKNEQPLELIYMINKNSYLQFFLAPKFDD